MAPMTAEVCLPLTPPASDSNVPPTLSATPDTDSTPPASETSSSVVSLASSQTSIDLCDPQLQEEIRQARASMQEDLAANPEAYDQFDVDKVMSSDWYVARFLLRRHRDVKAGTQMMIDCMRWRKEMDIPNMTDQDFPAEFYQIGGIFPYENDQWGNRVVYLRIHMHRKIPELADAIKRFVLHVMNKTDVEVDGRGMAVLFDCSGAGIQNADMDFLWFLISSMRNYFPEGLAYVLVYELPWILKSCWTMAKTWVPEDDRKMIKFAGKKDVTDWIPRDNLPDYMGGLCKRSYRTVPEGCPTAEEAGEKYGFRPKDLKRLREMFAKHLDS